jgi:2-polyprenyl-3-methyl-5-hydroxy-6-metoxy-1,4-benzoquinol methylase
VPRIDLDSSVGEIAAQIQAAYADQSRYVSFHAPRYAFLLKLLASRISDVSNGRVLDVGTSAFTALARDTLGIEVDTLDLPEAQHQVRGYEPARRSGAHHVFDLNDVLQREKWPVLDTYDVVLLCEVIEHLTVSPLPVLQFVRGLLPPGGWLMVQTPNAVSLSKRVKMLAGRNPYELLRDDATDPGHVREYTRSELEGYARAAGLEVHGFHYHSNFDARFRGSAPARSGDRGGALRNRLNGILPAAWRPGMTAELRPATAGAA